MPELRSQRERVRQAVEQRAAGLDKSRPLARRQIETHAREILGELDLSQGYLGWTMVILGSAFWREHVVSVPIHRRLLLLPHCLRNAETCPAKYDTLGLMCQNCGACMLSELKATAVARGYRVLIAEGSPIVLQLILGGQADAVLGVGCLNSLEKALDKILLAGLPSMAVPLFHSSCRNTMTDEDWAREMIDTPYQQGTVDTRTQVHLLRAATRMFDVDELERLAPRVRGGPRLSEANGQGMAALDPLSATEAIAYDFLVGGGKHLRPFITLAAYDAMTGGRGSRADGAAHVGRIPDAVRRVALSMELFHKASLVHDDIEDDDAFRYGRPTMHRKYGTPTAINVGDYLIGLGYRLVASQRDTLAADVVGDLLAQLSEAHTKLCEGQGAELAWAASREKRLAPLDVMKIYALKTAPAFEAALLAGIRLAGPTDDYRRGVTRFSRHLGVAFQIRNDLNDWRHDGANKRSVGADVLGQRPTLLWALAMESLHEKDRRRLESILLKPCEEENAAREMVDQVRQLYERADVFRQARELIQKHSQRARAVADEIHPEELGLLLSYFVDSIVGA